MSATTTASAPKSRRQYVPAVGPKLKKLLYVVFGLTSLLLANAAYLASITFLEWTSGEVYQNYFYQVMFLAHLVLGFLFIAPLVVFGVIHLCNARNRKNRRAVRVGYVLFTAALVVLVSGLLLVRISGFFDLKQPAVRTTVYWLHVAAPLAAAWLYWLHRLAGPPIKWRFGLAYLGLVGLVVGGMVLLHSHDPRKWNVVGPEEGVQYFEPSLARTASGNFIPAESLMMDDYCRKCHPDAHAGWKNSAHHFSSFNNPAYLASVRETREFSMEKDGNVKRSRWCAGCHDPVPFFSGAFDNPDFDDVNHPTAHAGVTCTTCHAITNVNSNRGNADFTIEEPQHYPFAFSENAALQWVNNQLVKANPTFHKKTFLKPFHKTSEFCSTCHKVHLPKALNDYKFLRGQNHYDSWLLSGVSGHGAASFYYPKTAQTNCNGCHMPPQPSDDFGADFFAGADELSIHNHLFPSANTGVTWMKHKPDAVEAHQEFLDGVMRVDIFGLREDGGIEGELHAPLRPEVPTLEAGETYLLDTVIRTLTMGHHFTQGTVDSNQVWLDVTVTAGDRVIGKSGGMDEKKMVDRWAHFVNVFMLDREGRRINRRNPQDIFVPLYNHQIPPGAGQTVHYRLILPDDLNAPVTVNVQLKYRKFDRIYMDYVADEHKPGDPPLRGHEPDEEYVNNLPVTVLAEDEVTFPVAGVDAAPQNPPQDIPEWQRWNDYGIGLLLKGEAELRQAAHAFSQVAKLGRYDGPLNLARVLFREGRLDEAVAALKRAAEYEDPAPPPWTLAWLSGQVNRQQGHLREAVENFRSVLEDDTAERRRRDFDFSRDYRVRNSLGMTLFDLARQQRGAQSKDRRTRFLQAAVETFQKTLEIDSENVTAHYNLQLLYSQLGRDELAEKHRKLHARYKPDDNARGRAVRLARERYPAADHASSEPVIYPLRRTGAPELPQVAQSKR